jgi:hypothetical protein
MTEVAPSIVVGGQEGAPFVLAGPPGQLFGRIQLHNRGDARVVLRDAGLTVPAGALRLPPARHAVPTVVLRPNQSGSVPLTISLDPATPHGEYRAELEVGGQALPVVLQVAETFALTVLPSSLVLANQPGVPQKKQLIVSNTGNVAFTLGEPTTVDLRDNMPRDAALRVAIEPLLEGNRPDLDALVVALLAVAREQGQPLGSLEARAREKIELQPGVTKVLDLDLTLQQELPRNRRCRGWLPILTEDVELIVVGSGAPEEQTTIESERPTATRPVRPRRTRGTKP